MRYALLAFVTFLFFSCSKSESCSDGIHNQGETLIDCGGPCAACPTCYDGVQNQAEQAVDCGGGVCAPCATCSDGTKNQGELAVDCGGPCAKCLIVYPAGGINGGNVLRVDTISLKADLNQTGTYAYSFKAELREGRSLKIIMKNTTDGSNAVWYYFPNSNTGWTISAYDYATNRQVFDAPGPAVYDVKMIFNGSGSATLDFYEDGGVTPVRSKSITWKI
jgi:hypothetical protein